MSEKEETKEKVEEKSGSTAMENVDQREDGELNLNSKSLVTKLEKPEDLFVFQCECKNMHFRHAGYMEILIPYIKGNKEKKITKDSYQVQVCTKCKKCYIFYSDKMYDVTDHIDLKAWEEAEVELNKSTGPGGEC